MIGNLTPEVNPQVQVNLSVIEEEDKQIFDHTYFLNSNSENEMKRNFSGFQEDNKFFIKPSSSSHSLKFGPNPIQTPKVKKKSSFDPLHFKKMNLNNDIADEDIGTDNDGINNNNINNKNSRNINSNKNDSNNNVHNYNVNIYNSDDISINNHANFIDSINSKDNKLHKITKHLSIDEKIETPEKNNPQKPSLSDAKIPISTHTISEQSSIKNYKYMNEMKNFTRKKLTLSDFERLLLNFFTFEFDSTRLNTKDENVLLGDYSTLWLFFHGAIQIMLYLQKETRAIVEKLKKNIKDSIKIKNSFQKYQKNEDIENYLNKKKWKGYLDEIHKSQEFYEQTTAKINFLLSFLENSLEKFIDRLPNDKDLVGNMISEEWLNDKILETFTVFEGNLKALNTYTGLTTFSEERLLVLSRIEKKESFINFVEIFDKDVKKRYQDDLKALLICFICFFKKIAQQNLLQTTKDQCFQRSLNDNCLHLMELGTISTKKVNNLILLKKSTCDRVSSILLPFYENIEKNIIVLNNAEQIFSKIFLKIQKNKKKIKFLRESFPNNFFLPLREKHCLVLLEELQTLAKEIRQEIDLIPFFRDFPNYELEIIKIEEICRQYQDEFRTNEGKEQTHDKVIFLAGKLHNLRLFLKQLQEKDCTKNSLLMILESSLQTQLNSSYKLYDYLLKILNSAHSSELQKIKVIERNVNRIIDSLFHYYESLELPSNFVIEDKLIEMIAFKREIDNLSHLQDLPDIYHDICLIKGLQLEQEIEKLTVFEDLKLNGREKISNNRIRNTILSVKYDKKSLELETLISQLDKYTNIMKYVSRLHPKTQNLLERICEVVVILKVFDEIYNMFFLKFLTVSTNYDEIKYLVSSYHESLIRKLEISLDKAGLQRNVDRQFFLQCAEFFFINTKNFFQSVIPESIEHIFNQTNHLLREIRGKIDNFYENRENLRVMAVGYTRQLNIIKVIDQFLKVIDKLRDSKEEDSQRILETKEHLSNLKEIVEALVKPCHVASLFDEFLDDLKKNKSLRLDQKIEKTKEMLQNLNEKLQILEKEEKKGIKDEKIASLYLYVKDDIKKVNGYISKLLPNVEEFAFFSNLMELNRLELVLEEKSIENFEKLHIFNKKIENLTDANEPLIFNDRNKINNFIQEYYFHWYGIIQSFLSLFDFEALPKIINCFKSCKETSLQKILSEITLFYDKLEVDSLNKKLNNKEIIDLKHKLSSFKNILQEIDLSFFTLSHLEINKKKYPQMNKIDGLENYIETMQKKFNFNLLRDFVYGNYRISEKYAMGENALKKTLVLKEIANFKKNFEGVQIPDIFKKWTIIVEKFFVV